MVDTQNFSVKITRKNELIKFVNNDMTTNYYYLVQGRIYNENKTKYKIFKFIVFFDAYDIQEYFDKNSYTKKDVEEYLDIAIYSFTQFIESYEDTDYFYKLCNKTIKDYNK